MRPRTYQGALLVARYKGRDQWPPSRRTQWQRDKIEPPLLPFEGRIVLGKVVWSWLGVIGHSSLRAAMTVAQGEAGYHG